MTFPLAELSELIAKRDATIGVVVSISDGIATIATTKGAIHASASAGVARGDRVMVRNGVAVKMRAASASYPV